MLLTALLVLAILASATLVFSTRVELLRLAVILSLWAAVLAAFVSVIYRRQSEVDEARARDMKFVYDLQLDREITARREYELSVEAQLRRQLSKEVRAQAADEMTALRAELAALRTNLEVMLGADLSVRPALEAERRPMQPPPGRVHSSRVAPPFAEAVAASVTVTETVFIESSAVEIPIIDVPEEPLAPQPEPSPQAQPVSAPQPRGSHRRTGGAANTVTAANTVAAGPPAAAGPAVAAGPTFVYAEQVPSAPPAPPWRPPETGQGRHRTGGDPGQADSVRGRHRGGGPSPASAGRHRPPNDVPAHEAPDAQPQEEAAEPQGQHADGQSFSEMMAKFEVRGPVGGGGRRRRED